MARRAASIWKNLPPAHVWSLARTPGPLKLA